MLTLFLLNRDFFLFRGDNRDCTLSYLLVVAGRVLAFTIRLIGVIVVVVVLHKGFEVSLKRVVKRLLMVTYHFRFLVDGLLEAGLGDGGWVGGGFVSVDGYGHVCVEFGCVE